MPSALENVQWPKTPEVATEIKNVLAEFYRLADLKDPDAGIPMSEHVFTHDALIVMPVITFNGKEEIAGARKHVWDTVTFRRHTVKAAHIGDLAGRDILLTGTVETHPRDGNVTIQEFASRAVFDEDKDGKLRIKTYRVWGGKFVSP
ncbi:hypothetical protein H2200_006323 [Cladophialophora chaetospira]|uniref:SnoaL-like domain-containing protein n=1 Tax=Cladophialophora chaetospira TaxID=386627 RepID=A0AA38XBD9_9EURO|nr:hypothetical protein H2200_006323 [Cladophialophora chaetospira]